MEELKLIMEMVRGLPQMAIWVLAGILLYKVAIIGSIFGVAKLLIERIHSWAMEPKDKLIRKSATVEVDAITITGEKANFLRQLERISGVSCRITTRYIHDSDIEWLTAAITEKMQRDEKKTK